MKPARPSRTAHLVALARAVADAGLSQVPEFRDPTAHVFLNEKGKQSLAKTVRAAREGKQGFRQHYARAMADMMALRTVAIDAAVRNAVREGAKQLVILGAGYDGRAWRMPELIDVKVLEVDHPATQGAKRGLVRDLTPTARDISFVAINFERESLDHVLDRAGHDASLPTCWIWEGVVMYLTRDAMRATLATIARRSTKGSTLIVNYHTPHRRRLFMRMILRLIGEPHVSTWSPDEMAEDLRAAGFVVREDSSIADWNDRFAKGRGNIRRAPYMRVAVARA